MSDEQRNQNPLLPPIYLCFTHVMKEKARSHGYALAYHGSMTTDFDIIAVPWTERAAPPDVLVAGLCRAIGAPIPHPHDKQPENKPHGRMAWLIPLGGGAAIDISVMPRIGATP